MVRQARRVLVSCSIATALLSAGADAADAPARQAAPIAVAPAALDWQPVPLLTGMMVARVWGSADGPQARFVKMPASSKLPLHKHTATVRVVVVSGTYVYGLQGAPEKHYDPGSFIVTPGGVPHVAGCHDACLYFEDVDAKPDFIPISVAR